MPDEPAKQPVFTGKFRHALDSKHRVAVPARWRCAEGEPFFVVPSHLQQSLYVLPAAEFHRVYAAVKDDPSLSPEERRMFNRHFFSAAQHCELDKQRRLLVPDDFCEMAGLEAMQTILLVGAYDRFEIWNPDRWLRAEQAEEPKVLELQRRLGQ